MFCAHVSTVLVSSSPLGLSFRNILHVRLCVDLTGVVQLGPPFVIRCMYGIPTYGT